MFSFFKECPHPDDKQRKELSRELGLEPLQVKFWFQNKRTQMKVNKFCSFPWRIINSFINVGLLLDTDRSHFNLVKLDSVFIIFPVAYFNCFILFVRHVVLQTQHERHENTSLRNENEKLRADNMRYREALSNASCPNCGGPTAIGEMSFDEHHLRLENARLREEVTLEKLSTDILLRK